MNNWNLSKVANIWDEMPEDDSQTNPEYMKWVQQVVDQGYNGGEGKFWVLPGDRRLQWNVDEGTGNPHHDEVREIMQIPYADIKHEETYGGYLPEGKYDNWHLGVTNVIVPEEAAPYKGGRGKALWHKPTNTLYEWSDERSDPDYHHYDFHTLNNWSWDPAKHQDVEHYNIVDHYLEPWRNSNPQEFHQAFPDKYLGYFRNYDEKMNWDGTPVDTWRLSKSHIQVVDKSLPKWQDSYHADINADQDGFDHVPWSFYYDPDKRQVTVGNGWTHHIDLEHQGANTPNMIPGAYGNYAGTEFFYPHHNHPDKQEVDDALREYIGDVPKHWWEDE